MLNKKLIIIAKSAPPEVCGVSDYAYNSALALTKHYESIEIGVNKLPNNKPVNAYKIPVKTWPEVLDGISKSNEPVDIILNYTPTSFSRLSFPWTLVLALKKKISANKKNRLFVHFHEMWSGNKNLKLHHNIMDKFAKWTMTELINIADGVAVFTAEQKEKLDNNFTVSEVSFIPIASNILPQIIDEGLRSQRNKGELLVFGLAHTRLWTLQKNLSLIKTLYNSGVLKKIIAIGPVNNKYSAAEAELVANNLGSGVLFQLGTLASADVSAQLLLAEAALLGQAVESLPKSGTFAALAAHAVPTILDVPATLLNPPGSVFLNPSEIIKNPAILCNEDTRKKQKELYNWYLQACSWGAVGEALASWIDKCPSKA